ncbi:hypothetical protein D3C80_1224550 [compost metagenome]
MDNIVMPGGKHPGRFFPAAKIASLCAEREHICPHLSWSKIAGRHIKHTRQCGIGRHDDAVLNQQKALRHGAGGFLHIFTHTRQFRSCTGNFVIAFSNTRHICVGNQCLATGNTRP